MPTETVSTPLERPWWRDSSLGVLVLLVLAVYFTRIGALTIRGEESRRIGVAHEMLATGDTIVPREQGTVFSDRPPLGSWVILLAEMVTGNADPVTVRLPTVLATLATTVLIYAYARSWLSALGAFAAGAAYATMVQVLELGRLAETEATLTVLVASSLLLWNWGYASGWPRVLTWLAGYVFAALAALAKGPQGPVYFVGGTGLFLALRRDWRYWLSWQHAVGLAGMLGVIAVWQVPYAQMVDWLQVKQTWGTEVGKRMVYDDPSVVVKHVLRYPWEVLGCMLPWSVLLIAAFDKSLRQSIAAFRAHVWYLVACIVVSFPTVWFAPGARGRYYMPIYPCFAVLIGLMVEQAFHAPEGTALRRAWRWFMAGLAIVAGGLAVGVLVATIAGRVSPESELAAIGLSNPLGFVVAYVIVAAILCGMLWSLRRAVAPRQAMVGVLAVAVLMGTTYTGLMINALVARASDTRGEVESLRSRLPLNAQLVSLGIVHHLFRYHYGEPIRLVPWAPGGPPASLDFDYFCFTDTSENPLDPGAGWQPGFKWEPVAVISCDRNRRDNPRDRVIVGRRECDKPIGTQ